MPPRALAQAVGRAVGYDSTALLLIEKDTATLSVVQTDDGSVVKVLSRDLHDSDAMAVLTEMAAAVESAESPPQGLFIVGSGVDVGSVKAHLENLVALPVSAPEEPELALARGAALASAHAPELEASTAGLAYSQDPDGTTAGSVYPVELDGAATQLAPVGAAAAYSDAIAYSDDVEPDPEPDAEPYYGDESRKPFLLVGSALTSIFVVGVVALVISLAVSIRPTVDQRPSPGETPVIPSQAAPAPAPAQELAPACRACARATPAGANHQGARAGGAASPGASAPDGVRRAARARGSSASTSGRTAAASGGPADPDPGSSDSAADSQPAGLLPAEAAGLGSAVARPRPTGGEAPVAAAVAAVAADSGRTGSAACAAAAVPVPGFVGFGFGRLPGLGRLRLARRLGRLRRRVRRLRRRRRFRLARRLGWMLPYLLRRRRPLAGYLPLVSRSVSLSS